MGKVRSRIWTDFDVPVRCLSEISELRAQRRSPTGEAPTCRGYLNPREWVWFLCFSIGASIRLGVDGSLVILLSAWPLWTPPSKRW